MNREFPVVATIMVEAENFLPGEGTGDEYIQIVYGVDQHFTVRIRNPPGIWQPLEDGERLTPLLTRAVRETLDRMGELLVARSARPPGIRDLAIAKGFKTQKALIEASGLSHATIGKTWRWGCGGLHQQTLNRLAKTLGVEPSYLLQPR
ncbi:MAG: hypothetical protein A3C90_01035 [Candidatus Magasanikbacteria bacterium RIFCSPHIGHO2_02_FULL_51_14]|uniref:Uncharacterized protein n=1 Tax=Candidatus Magasanikbacteria bacterium RIFCSPHIGHO2_02_FULL_51_14 TaxID=1798683 RepID=A0A1F6MFB8_9BACT|nr:MAG: hypothetical protein A3C90_01035 [Candidatus Magasanikbacteria bacterium RIFCSPHIGHO2_02_FULL_51_14]